MNMTIKIIYKSKRFN